MRTHEYSNPILSVRNDNRVCTHSGTRMIGKDDRSDYSDDLHECIGDSHVSVMTSECDTNLFAQINIQIRFVLAV